MMIRIIASNKKHNGNSIYWCYIIYCFQRAIENDIVPLYLYICSSSVYLYIDCTRCVRVNRNIRRVRHVIGFRKHYKILTRKRDSNGKRNNIVVQAIDGKPLTPRKSTTYLHDNDMCA